LRVTRWPTVSWRTFSFLGGFSFLGFWFLPTWLMAPLFFLTPAFGPLLLALAGLLAMRHSRAISNHPALKPGRLFVAFLISCAILLVPMAVFDIYSFSFLTYITLLVVEIVLPFHLVCVGTFAGGLYALSRAGGRLVFRCVLPVIVGFLAGAALTFVRFQFVPQSHGVFLKGFAASGSALHPGQKDINETLGDKPRSLHEPVAVIGDDSLWIVRRSQQGASSDYWIERRTIAPGGSNWRTSLPRRAGVDPQSDRPGPWSRFQHLPRRLRRRRRE
jgi:hypothetical protein